MQIDPGVLKFFSEMLTDAERSVINPRLLREKWCRREESNSRPSHYECAALPTELRRPTVAAAWACNGESSILAHGFASPGAVVWSVQQLAYLRLNAGNFLATATFFSVTYTGRPSLYFGESSPWISGFR